MDPFGYYPRENARALEREREESRVSDGWSPDRRELRELLGRLRDRYGRRRVFRVFDVERELLAMGVEDFPRTLWRDAPPTRPRVVIDLTVD